LARERELTHWTAEYDEHEPSSTVVSGILWRGIVFIVLSIPLIQERVPPNSFYGFRTAPRHLQGEEGATYGRV
jgi:hypothetical protein